MYCMQSTKTFSLDTDWESEKRRKQRWMDGGIDIMDGEGGRKEWIDRQR